MPKLIVLRRLSLLLCLLLEAMPPYHMLSSKKLVDDTGEKAFSGYDVKFSGQAPYLPWAKIKGTY
jgi:hypothetical protein